MNVREAEDISNSQSKSPVLSEYLADNWRKSSYLSRRYQRARVKWIRRFESIFYDKSRPMTWEYAKSRCPISQIRLTASNNNLAFRPWTTTLFDSFWCKPTLAQALKLLDRLFSSIVIPGHLEQSTFLQTIVSRCFFGQHSHSDRNVTAAKCHSLTCLPSSATPPCSRPHVTTEKMFITRSMSFTNLYCDSSSHIFNFSR